MKPALSEIQALFPTAKGWTSHSLIGEYAFDWHIPSVPTVIIRVYSGVPSGEVAVPDHARVCAINTNALNADSSTWPLIGGQIQVPFNPGWAAVVRDRVLDMIVIAKNKLAQQGQVSASLFAPVTPAAPAQEFNIQGTVTGRYPSEPQPQSLPPLPSPGGVGTFPVASLPDLAAQVIGETKKARLAEVREHLKTNKHWAVAALLEIYARQTADEKSSEQTSHLNGVGFGAFDAEILSSFAKQYQKKGWLSDKQIALLHKRIARYAGQFLSVLDGISKQVAAK